MMKKMIAVLLALMLVIACVPALAETQHGVCTTPTADGSAYVRRSAGEGQPIVGSARNGDELIILQRGNTWHKVQVVRTGVSGWMYGAYISFTDSVTEINSSGRVSSNAGYANFRTGPSTAAELICRLSNGTGVEVLRKTDSWYYVYCASQHTHGYISVGLVALNASIEAETAQNMAVVESSDGFANLRRGPGTDYGIVTALSNGVQVEIVSTTGHWSRVNVPQTHHYGYVYTNLLRSVGSASTLYDTGKINSSDGFANLRTGPGTQHGVKARLYNGVMVSIVGTEGNWIQVQLSDTSDIGYVYAPLLEILTPSGIMTATGDVNLRSGPGVEYARLTTVTEGSRVSVLGESGNFVHVNAGGWIGWLSRNYVK